MDYSNLAQPWAQSEINTNTRLPITRNFLFYYIVHQGHLEFFETEIKVGKKKKLISLFIPRFDSEQIRAGVNGVKQVRGELGDAGPRLGQLQQDGYVILDFNRHDYLRTYPAEGGTFYAPKWAKFETIAGRVIRSFDDIGFLKWKLELMLAGQAPTPHKVFIDLMIRDFEKVPKRWANRTHEPVAKAQYEKQSAKLERMQAIFAELENKTIQEQYQEVLDVLK